MSYSFFLAIARASLQDGKQKKWWLPQKSLGFRYIQGKTVAKNGKALREKASQAIKEDNEQMAPYRKRSQEKFADMFQDFKNLQERYNEADRRSQELLASMKKDDATVKKEIEDAYKKSISRSARRREE